ncbi:Ala-tRNA(Pro) deacylase [Salinivibrio sp. ES.052]|nr:Ala-tRNA(Pro) deacylase [Salinivibrio sp. ES.052]
MLDSAQVTYQILWQSHATQSIEQTAAQRGICPSQMLKTIVLRDMGGRYAMACVPGDQQVSPPKVRQYLGCRRMTLANAEQVRTVTGYELGAVAPLATPHSLPVFFDRQIWAYDTVTISSGDRHAGLWVKVEDLIALCQPTLADICRAKSSEAY